MCLPLSKRTERKQGRKNARSIEEFCCGLGLGVAPARLRTVRRSRQRSGLRTQEGETRVEAGLLAGTQLAGRSWLVAE